MHPEVIRVFTIYLLYLMRKALFFFLVAFFCHQFEANAQSTCAQTLRLAQSVYEQGRLQELPNLLEACLKTGFTDQEKVNAYKLLTLTYIYLEEPQKADNSMLLLLQTNNEFRPNDAVDPAEFVALYHTFRTNPVYRIGFKAGAIATQPNVVSSDYVSAGTSSYKYGFGLNVAVSAELPLKGKFKKIVFNPELTFQSRTFTGKNQEGIRTSSMIERQSWISVPLLLQYTIRNKEDKFMLFSSLGAAPEYLASASQTLLSERTGFSPIEERPIDRKNLRNAFNVSALVAAGMKQKISKGYLVLEVRYQYGLMPVLSENHVYGDIESILDYNYVDGIYKLTGLSLSVGYILNRYNPKKLTK